MVKIESVEDRQLPRWVYALRAMKADPNDNDFFNDTPKLRGENQVKAEGFYKERQARLKVMSEQENYVGTSRMDGREWMRRPRTTFTSEELDKIMPTRRVSYIVKKTILISIIMTGVILATSASAFVIAAICAEIKLGGNFEKGYAIFSKSPDAYVERVYNALFVDEGFK